MTRLRPRVHTRVVPDHVVADLRTKMPHVVARIASAIQAEVPAYAGSSTSARRKVIEGAVSAGLNDLHGLLIGRGRSDPKVDQLFRDLGNAEGVSGLSLDSMRAALDVARRETWNELQRVVIAHGLSPAAITQVVDLLFEQTGRVRKQFESGYLNGCERRRTDPTVAREALADALLGSADVGEIRRLAEIAGQGLPLSLLVLSVRVDQDKSDALLAQLDPDILVVAARSHVLVLGDANIKTALVDQIRRVAGAAVIAVSFPCRPAQIVDAVRLNRRALGLVEAGAIPRTEVVDCADNEVALWLHAEPILTDRLAETLLAPLELKSAHRRAVFAETMLLWLEQRPSAPRLAAQLGVHPQTVRVRMRKLERMFDDQLQDPDLAFATMLALKAKSHEWIPGKCN